MWQPQSSTDSLQCVDWGRACVVQMRRDFGSWLIFSCLFVRSYLSNYNVALRFSSSRSPVPSPICFCPLPPLLVSFPFSTISAPPFLFLHIFYFPFPSFRPSSLLLYPHPSSLIPSFHSSLLSHHLLPLPFSTSQFATISIYLLHPLSPSSFPRLFSFPFLSPLISPLRHTRPHRPLLRPPTARPCHQVTAVMLGWPFPLVRYSLAGVRGAITTPLVRGGADFEGKSPFGCCAEIGFTSVWSTVCCS